LAALETMNMRKACVAFFCIVSVMVCIKLRSNEGMNLNVYVFLFYHIDLVMYVLYVSERSRHVIPTPLMNTHRLTTPHIHTIDMSTQDPNPRPVRSYTCPCTCPCTRIPSSQTPFLTPTRAKNRTSSKKRAEGRAVCRFVSFGFWFRAECSFGGWNEGRVE
jgi:hypothetical protein